MTMQPTFPGPPRVVTDLQTDIERVTGRKPAVITERENGVTPAGHHRHPG